MPKKISIVTPAFNEAKNLPVLYERLKRVLDSLGDWEWVIVDDHSKDNTFAVGCDLHDQDPRVHIFRLSRNSGSHMAILCGFEKTQGEVGGVLAADLQDPPETLPLLLEKWKQGAQIVWATRAERIGETRRKVFLSTLFHRILKRILDAEVIPTTVADFFIMDRIAIDALLRFRERKTNIAALTIWMGFRQEYISYVKEARLYGTSGWNFKKNLSMLRDSITSFTALPLRAMFFIGSSVAAIAFIYAVWVIVWSFIGRPISGWASLMVVSMFLGGLQLIMLGVLGEYLWSALDEIRARPRYLIEDFSKDSSGSANP